MGRNRKWINNRTPLFTFIDGMQSARTFSSGSKGDLRKWDTSFRTEMGRRGKQRRMDLKSGSSSADVHLQVFLRGCLGWMSKWSSSRRQHEGQRAPQTKHWNTGTKIIHITLKKGAQKWVGKYILPLLFTTSRNKPTTGHDPYPRVCKRPIKYYFEIIKCSLRAKITLVT